MGVGIFIEEPDGIDEVRADDWIAADTDAGRLTDLPLRELPDRFVGQRSTARNHADVSFEMNMSRHDSDLALPGEMIPGQLGPIRRVFVALQKRAGANHVEGRECLP